MDAGVVMLGRHSDATGPPARDAAGVFKSTASAKKVFWFQQTSLGYCSSPLTARRINGLGLSLTDGCLHQPQLPLDVTRERITGGALYPPVPILWDSSQE